jgi:hypothetical protein
LRSAKENEATKLRPHGFDFETAEDFLNAPSIVRNAPGVYGLLLTGGKERLRQVIPNNTTSCEGWSWEKYDLMYLGESLGLRSRLFHHLAGCIRSSDFRYNLLALQFEHKIIWPVQESSLAVLENRLDDWLIQNCLIAFQCCRFQGDREIALIKQLESPLNIKGNLNGAYNVALRQARKRFREHLNSTGQWPRHVPKQAADYFMESRRNQREGA